MFDNIAPNLMLANYNSLWEVFTAFFSSMLLSDILGGIWTPEYKRTVVRLIKDMGIPFVETLSKKLDSQIDVNVAEISGHMHRRAIFMIVFCICLLGFAAANQNMGFTKASETEILFLAVTAGLLVVLAGTITFRNYAITSLVCIAYGVLFFLLCHFGHGFELSWSLLEDEKYAIAYLLLFMSIPIVWQIISCWIYSSLYYNKLKDDLHREEQLYKMAIIGIRTRNIEVVPPKYKVRAAVDINKQITSKEDISYESCDDILFKSVDSLLENPIALKILFSWLKNTISGFFTKKKGDDAEFINAQFEAYRQVDIPVSGLSHRKNGSISGSESLGNRLSEDSNIPSTTKKKLIRIGKYGSLLLGFGTVIFGLFKMLIKK